MLNFYYMIKKKNMKYIEIFLTYIVINIILNIIRI